MFDVAPARLGREFVEKGSEFLFVKPLLFRIFPGAHQAAEATALWDQAQIDEFKAGGQHQRQARSRYQGECCCSCQANPIVLPFQGFLDEVDLVKAEFFNAAFDPAAQG
jgi:hypothetical protein